MAVAAAAFPEVGKDLTPWNGPGPGQGSSSWDEDPLVDVQLVGIAQVIDPDDLLDRDAIVSGDPVQGLPRLYDVKEARTLLLVCGVLIWCSGHRRADIGRRLRATATGQAQGQGQSGESEECALSPGGVNEFHSREEDIKGRCASLELRSLSIRV
jgi:hypothetical protein